MDNFSYTSYPDSGDSSPRSREVEFENPPQPWEEHSQTYKVKFMCSYWGKIHPRPHDNQLSYVSGETKILVVDRNIKFSAMISKLSALCDAAEVSFKYQLPGEDLDALISVTNDDDLEHMMHEHDRMIRASVKPTRMRLFLFPVNSSSFGSEKSGREGFVEDLNTTPTKAEKVEDSENQDYFFSLDKGIPPPPAAKSVPEQVIKSSEFPIGSYSDNLDAICSDSTEIQMQLQELQRLKIRGNEQPTAGDYYVQKMPEKAPMATLPPPVTYQTGYWPENQFSGGRFPAPEQPVYMMHAPQATSHGTVYHAPMMRQVTGQTAQGYFMQRMSPDIYREHPAYNAFQQPQLSAAPLVNLPQQPPKVAASGYSEGMGMVQPGGGGGGGEMGMYPQMAYDGSVGRQMYYPAPGVMMPPQRNYQGVAMVSADSRPATGLGQDASQASM